MESGILSHLQKILKEVEFPPLSVDPLVLLESMDCALALVNDQSQLAWFNPAFSKLCDGTPELGAIVYDVLGSALPEACPITECIKGAEDAKMRTRLRSGRHLEIQVRPFPVRTADDHRQFICQCRDVTTEVRQRRKLVAIHRAGLELSHLTAEELSEMSTGERIELLKANVLHYSHNILKFKNLEIRLLDGKSKRLNVLLSVGLTAPAADRELFAKTEGNGVTGFVAATGRSYRCDDVAADRLYIPGAPDARSSLTVPIMYIDRVIGTFNVESPAPRHFTASDQEFLEIFAREIAVALNTLELLRVEKSYGSSASVEAILGEVGVPVDEIVADAMRVLGKLAPSKDTTYESIQRILQNARSIKESIQQVGRSADVGKEVRRTDSHEAGKLAGRKVLLADNDPDVRRSAHRLLAKVNCLVDTAKNAAEALSLLKGGNYDVVMGDIRLPDMNGYEFFRQVREIQPTVPIILLTGFGYDANHCIVRARQDGMRVVLFKPFRMDRLRESVEEALCPAPILPPKLPPAADN